ncbi:intercellular adhesion molecule 5-like [Hyla sarda]|uniref:intercellular adhesion molecule 5-like n=1 Tax=Hyla sarda TaxID=327740 RepID=UPI0024C3D2B9|nr:intercellular adhesion molecule 5-like [Hyla sarda]
MAAHDDAMMDHPAFLRAETRSKHRLVDFFTPSCLPIADSVFPLTTDDLYFTSASVLLAVYSTACSPGAVIQADLPAPPLTAVNLHWESDTSSVTPPRPSTNLLTMEVSCLWSLIIITILRICKVHALLPIPIISMEEKVKIDEETKVTCSLPASECRCLEVELRIITEEKLKNCVSHKGNFPNVTCTLEVTKDMHEVELSCEAHFRTKSKPQKLNIQTEPEFTDCPDKLVWIEGQENSFHCKAKGYPAPTVTCVKDSTVYMDGEKFITHKNMSGDFNCRAANFDVVSKTVTVSVQYEPKISLLIVEPSDAVVEGENLTLICEADAVPPPLYSWHTPTPQLLYDHDNRTIQIKDAKKVHDGFYICIAQNKHGIQMRKQKITVNEPEIVPEVDLGKLSKDNGADKMGPADVGLFTVLIFSSFYYLF